MRIVSGNCKGRNIVPPKRLDARPTTDFAKENIFNVINNNFDLESVYVLDLFSGTGSISYEFASRGALKVVSVEMNHLHHSFIKSTATSLKLSSIIAIKSDVFAFTKRCVESFDIIFSDAPYDLATADSLIDIILDKGMLKPDGWLIFEHSKGKDYSNHPRFKEHRSYGSVNFSVFC